MRAAKHRPIPINFYSYRRRTWWQRRLDAAKPILWAAGAGLGLMLLTLALVYAAFGGSWVTQ